MPPEEVCAATRAADVERARGDEKNDDEDIADNGCAADGIELWCDGGVERIAGVEDGRDMNVIGWIARTNRLIDGISGQCYCMGLVDMYYSCAKAKTPGVSSSEKG